MSPSFSRLKGVRAALAIIAGLMAGNLIGLRAAHSEIVKQRPCDIYAAENTPCVAAHSTVRSLYAKYTGALYQVKPGSEISLQATTACCTGDYVRNQNGAAVIAPITSGSAEQDKGDSTWIVRRGLADNSCVSFESRNNPGDFLRHQNFVLHAQPFDGTV
jgi:non-reducing end alpha-L-arabinofuranosidase